MARVPPTPDHPVSTVSLRRSLALALAAGLLGAIVSGSICYWITVHGTAGDSAADGAIVRPHP